MFISCCLFLAFITTATLAEQIHQLPGLNFTLNFRHYSGFLQVSKTHFLHYWFVESQNDPATDPLIFWFNGGPGCSSLNGLLNIMGPFLVNEDGETLRENPHSWNKFSNIVYLESPAGVGFSYSTDGDITTDDGQTAFENYEAVKVFFKEFPAFRNHSIFVFGESYGGVYAPLLATLILDDQEDFPVNLKAFEIIFGIQGVGIGNGRLNNGQLARFTEVLYAYSHGFLSEADWKIFQRQCCPLGLNDCDRDFWSSSCVEHVQGLRKPDYFNMYDIYADCSDVSLDPFSLESHTSIGCLNTTTLSLYLNRSDVWAALRIPENAPTWRSCIGNTNNIFTSWYTRQYSDMTAFITGLIESRVRVLLYYGDTDYVCDFLMGQKFVDRLGLQLKHDKRPWLLDGQIAGFITLYGGGLTFTTIHGAGHMAPKNKAPQMARLVDYFLRDILDYL